MYIQDGVKYHANGKESEIIRSRNLQKINGIHAKIGIAEAKRAVFRKTKEFREKKK